VKPVGTRRYLVLAGTQYCGTEYPDEYRVQQQQAARCGLRAAGSGLAGCGAGVSLGPARVVGVVSCRVVSCLGCVVGVGLGLGLASSVCSLAGAAEPPAKSRAGPHGSTGRRESVFKPQRKLRLRLHQPARIC